MGLFNMFKHEREETKQEAETVTPQIDDVLLSALLSGEKITREKALTLPTVSAAVDLICNCVASMPVKLYKVKKGKVEEVENDARTTLLNGDTGDTLDAYQLKKAMVEDYLLGKGGYCYIKKNRNNVVGLYYVEDKNVSIITNTDPIFKNYSIIVGAKQYEAFDFIKLLRNTKDGASGKGVTWEVSKALETAYHTLTYQLGLVKTGGNKKGFIKSNKRLTQESIDLLKKAWNNLYTNNTENVVVLNDGLDFQESSNSSVEMQLNESKKTLQDEINGIFHIHADNFDQTFKEAIYPIVKAFETALNRDLLLEKEKKSMYFEFDVKEIVKANVTERYNAYQVAKNTGFMTLNEIRKAENMNYIEGLDVINVGLSSVLYNVDTQEYFTPNTGEMQGFGGDTMMDDTGMKDDTALDENMGDTGENLEEGTTDTEAMEDATGATETANNGTNEDDTEQLGGDEGLDEIDSDIDELEKELLGDVETRDLTRYASKYYDPAKAHAYYEANKKLKGRKSIAKLNDKGKMAAKYVKKKLQEEKKQRIEQRKEEMQAKIQQLRDLYKSIPSAERQAYHDEIYNAISGLRDEQRAFREKMKTDYDEKYLQELDKIKKDPSMMKGNKSKSTARKVTKQVKNITSGKTTQPKAKATAKKASTTKKASTSKKANKATTGTKAKTPKSTSTSKKTSGNAQKQSETATSSVASGASEVTKAIKKITGKK